MRPFLILQKEFEIKAGEEIKVDNKLRR